MGSIALTTDKGLLHLLRHLNPKILFSFCFWPSFIFIKLAKSTHSGFLGKPKAALRIALFSSKSGKLLLMLVLILILLVSSLQKFLKSFNDRDSSRTLNFLKGK